MRSSRNKASRGAKSKSSSTGVKLNTGGSDGENIKSARPAPSKSGRTGPLAQLTANPDGERPEDFVQRHTTLQTAHKKTIYEHLTAHSRISADGFLQFREKNTRAQVPIPEKRRVKLEKEGKESKDGLDYVPGQYVKLENTEYVILQAPTKDNCLNVWRLVWHDQIKVMISLSDKMSDSDPEKCYPYFPTEPKSSMTIESGRYTVTCHSKTGTTRGFTQYDLIVTSTDDADTYKEKDDETNVDTGGAKGKNMAVTMLHMDSWPSETWPDIENLAFLVRELFKAEMAIVRKSMDSFVPPVLIQSHDGVGRGCILWVLATLIKDVEKRECFDVEELVKKIVKMRPGAICTYLHLCITFAASFKIAEQAKWCPSDSKHRAAEIEKAYKERKVT